MNNPSFLSTDPTTTEKTSNIDEFYKEFGIKQYSSFSGGFRYINKAQHPEQEKLKQAPKRDLYE
jgi:hypothetical protein